MPVDLQAVARDAGRLRDHLASDVPLRYCDAAVVLGDDPALGVAALGLWREELFAVVVLPASAHPVGLPASATLIAPEAQCPADRLAAAHAALSTAGFRLTSLLVVCRPTQQRLATMLGSRSWPEIRVVPVTPADDPTADPLGAAHVALQDFWELQAMVGPGDGPPTEAADAAERLSAALPPGSRRPSENC